MSITSLSQWQKKHSQKIEQVFPIYHFSFPHWKKCYKDPLYLKNLFYYAQWVADFFFFLPLLRFSSGLNQNVFHLEPAPVPSMFTRHDKCTYLSGSTAAFMGTLIAEQCSQPL